MTRQEQAVVKGTGRLRVAAYIRVSTDLTDQENSYETQERYFNRLLSRNEEWLSAGVYSDYGISGTSGQKRTGFRRILRHCREGRIDRIVTKSISRFARNTTDFMMALDVLNETGVTILFEKEGLDTADATNTFVLTTLAAITQEESRSISANVNWSNQKRFACGDVGNRDIYGYRYTNKYVTTENGCCRREIEIVKEEAEVVLWIFQNYIDGMTFQDMAKVLNLRHVSHKRSPYTKKRMEHSRKGQLRADIDEGWTSEQIGSIVKNERYTGDVLVQKTYTEDYLTHKVRLNKGEAPQYWVRNHHPAIISRELFETARELRMTRSARWDRHGRGKPLAFSGRLICGRCGRFYHVRNTNYHPIWFCPSAARDNGKHLCCNEKVYEDQIVRMFRKAISDRFQLAVLPATPNMRTGDFVGQMQKRLENIQWMDFMERDRAFLKRQIRTLTTAESGEKQLTERLNYMENYWNELEENHEHRDKAIGWIKSLPPGKDGVIQLLDGMTDTYAKAFVLSIIIQDPLHYTVHWFDDTRTEVVLQDMESGDPL